MRLMSSVLAGLALFAASPSLAQSSSKSVQLAKVILDTETAEVKGKLKGGTLCVFPQKLKPVREKKTQDYERYDNIFADTMKVAGVTVVTTSADLFASDADNNKADYMIGAVIRPDTVNICSSVNGEKGNVTIDIDWQVYDRAKKEVVLTVTTRGAGVQEKFSRDGLQGMWNRAFVDSLNALLSQGRLQQIVGAPAPAAAAAK